jgi:hypothetical protein
MPLDSLSVPGHINSHISYTCKFLLLLISYSLFGLKINAKIIRLMFSDKCAHDDCNVRRLRIISRLQVDCESVSHRSHPKDLHVPRLWKALTWRVTCQCLTAMDSYVRKTIGMSICMQSWLRGTIAREVSPKLPIVSLNSLYEDNRRSLFFLIHYDLHGTISPPYQSYSASR